MKRIAIVQSNYIPWKGYFDIIAAVDEVILYDEMQYTRRDWRNRNQIKTRHGLEWLTVPVKVKGRYHQTIRQTEIDGTKWSTTHWARLHQSYCPTPHFQTVRELIEPLYTMRKYTHLSALNRTFIEAICGYLGIRTKISNSWDYRLKGGKSERLADLCAQAGGTVYLSGPSARAYLEEKAFTERGISVHWFEYAGYPRYPQLWGEFKNAVTILDLLFNCGMDAPRYMKIPKQCLRS